MWFIAGLLKTPFFMNACFFPHLSLRPERKRLLFKTCPRKKWTDIINQESKAVFSFLLSFPKESLFQKKNKRDYPGKRESEKKTTPKFWLEKTNLVAWGKNNRARNLICRRRKKSCSPFFMLSSLQSNSVLMKNKKILLVANLKPAVIFKKESIEMPKGKVIF